MRRHHLIAFCSMLLLCAACGGDQSPGRIAFNLALPQFESIDTAGRVFEGWALVSGQPVSTGQFVLDASVTPKRVTSVDGATLYGTTASASFGPASTGLGTAFPFITLATGFFIAVEPAGANDGVPGDVLMAADMNATGCVLTAAGVATGAVNWALGDWTSASGVVTLMTPTNGASTNASGVWFINGASTDAGIITPGLSIPTPTGAWRVQGWVRNSGATPNTFSTGQFTSAVRPDNDAQSTPTRGSLNIGPMVPGQDFINAVANTTPALDLASGTWSVEVTVEPAVDNSVAPFPLLLLSATIPTTAVNASGETAANVPLIATAALPQLTMNAASATSAAFTGSLPADLGGASAGELALWVMLPTALQPALLGRLRVAGPLVTCPATGSLLGTPSNFAVNSLSTGLGSGFPDPTQAVLVFLTVEAQGGPLPASFGATGVQPSAATLLSGNAVAGVATLTVAGLSAQGGIGLANFSAVAGACILAAPTAVLAPAAPAVDRNGIWFVDSITRAPTLVLPALPAGWVYEGWVRNSSTGALYSTGKFRSGFAADEDATTWPGSGTGGIPGATTSSGYAAPGQDFLTALTATSPGATSPALPQFTDGAWITLVTLEPNGTVPTAPSPWVVLTGSLPLSTNTTSPALLNMAAQLPGGTLSW